MTAHRTIVFYFRGKLKDRGRYSIGGSARQADALPELDAQGRKTGRWLIDSYLNPIDKGGARRQIERLPGAFDRPVDGLVAFAREYGYDVAETVTPAGIRTTLLHPERTDPAAPT